MATISFKVYLIGSRYDSTDVELETRRFCIDADVATNYVYLCEKLQTLFPSLRRKLFNIEWEDAENERIRISTNEELEIAIQEMSSKSGICKLYVRVQDNRERVFTLYGNEPATLHHYVTCDVCNININGIRFKCMQCENYDLCSNCMLLGHHDEHYLVRMIHKIEWSSREGRRLKHHIRKWTKHCKDDERRTNKNSKRHGCPVLNQTGKDETQEQKRSKEQQRDPSAEAATEATEEDPQEATRHRLSQIMKIVEDNISNITQFLDPLGINVSMMTDKDSAKDKAGSSQKTDYHVSTSEDSAKKFPGEGRKLNGETADEKATPSTSNTSSHKEPTTGTSAEQAAEAEEWTIVHSQGDSSSTSRASSTSSLKEAAPKQVTPSAPATETEMETEPEKTESSKPNIYPSLPQEVREEYYHPDPKIQQAVTAMMAMGFSNEGGWLTHLLVSKDGDIGKALDVLHPVRPR